MYKARSFCTEKGPRTILGVTKGACSNQKQRQSRDCSAKGLSIKGTVWRV